MGKKTLITVLVIQTLMIGGLTAEAINSRNRERTGQVECLHDDTAIVKRLEANEKLTLLIAQKHDKLMLAVKAIYEEIQEAMKFQGKLNGLFKALFYGRTV